MLNYIWLALVLLAVIVGGIQGRMQEVTEGAISSAKVAVELALGLIGVMALWLGVMRLAERSGLIQLLAKAMRPIMRRLFPDVPADHPAMGAMMMNMAANMLGLGNAATPLGLRAMTHLQRLNPVPGTASNAMCTFLAINTSSIQLIPATAVALLAGAGSANPSAIIGTAFLATSFAAIVGVTSAKLLEKLPFFAITPADVAAAIPEPENAGVALEPDTVSYTPPAPLAPWARLVFLALAIFIAWTFFTITFPKNLPSPGEARVVFKAGGGENTGKIVAETRESLTLEQPDGLREVVLKADTAKIVRHDNLLIRIVNAISVLAIPLLLAGFPLYAALRGIKVYEEFVEGAKEAFNVAIKIIPYLVTMLVAIGMFRGAGCIQMLTQAAGPLLEWIGFPPDLLTLALMRPLSGSGSNAIFADIIKTFGPDSFITRTAGTIIGSTETTFYVIAVYFGSVAVRRTRHAIIAGLLADTAGIAASVTICRLVFG